MESLIKCPACGRLVSVRLPVHECTDQLKKHGIEPRFSKGRKIKLLSYAVWVNGNCAVSHETTRGGAEIGDMQMRYAMERARNPKLPII